MAKVWIAGAVILGLLVTPLDAGAQPARVYRIGYLGTQPPTPATAPIWEALSQGLRERGYVEGQNLVLERRYSEGKAERLADFAAEFVRLKVDVIIAPGTPEARAAKAATSTIPIVTVIAGDPVGTGLVASLARPGGNVTGTASQATDLTGKVLQLLTEVVPGVSRVAVIWNPTNPAHRLTDLDAPARALRVRVESRAVRAPDEVDAALSAIARSRPQALIVWSDPVTFANRRRIIDFATAQKLPAVYMYRLYVEDGGLMAYDASWVDLFRRTGYYVDRILKGTKPANLPVEQPTRFELVVNQRAAKAIGLSIPHVILQRADRVIE